ncbi:MAG: MarR family winged helix-turn-helix transcriptional regulator [Pirellulaceae bacterium]|nr:MarR family winged helix-turn-helix transcriptional regulator [Pirellulaceae bacterium]
MFAIRTEVPSESADAVPFALGETIQLLWQCHRRLRRMLSERLNGTGLSDTEFLVLWLCHQSGPQGLAQRDLAESLGVSPPLMSGLVERLRQQKLLTGRRCQLDRRRQLWCTDTEGCRLLTRICADLQQLVVSLDQSISAQQQQMLTTLLRSLAEANAAFSASSDDGASGPTAVVSPLRVFQPDEHPTSLATER